MRLIPRAFVVLVVAVGCRAHPSPASRPMPCLVANPPTIGGMVIEPRWVRLDGMRTLTDTTGSAEIGAEDAAPKAGRWWQFSGDSVRVDASDATTGVWLRAQIGTDGAAGWVKMRTGSDVWSYAPWQGKWGACPPAASGR